MTKRERERLAEAVRLLYTDDGWDAAMRILLPLAGLQSPAMEAADRAKPVSTYEIAKGPDTEFVYSGA
jgi:hypothetical protein